MSSDPFDLLIIGAGINGAGLARDAAGRGKSVALVDAGDLGGGTSGASTKLIHGGLRYLEFYEFALVRKALAERETILSIAPHLAWPLPFVLPLSKDTRPGWMIRAGLFLYDHLARRVSFPNSHKVDLLKDPAGLPLAPRYRKAFRYWDGWIDDSRLVIANCQDAAAHGAEVIPRDAVVSAEWDGQVWTAELESGREMMARQVVNCAGPWAERVAKDVLRLNDGPRLNLVQGAHIIVPRIGPGEDAYMLQQPDGRIIFLIPYQERFTMIGTTETRVDDPAAAEITEAETEYLLAAANRFLERPLSNADIVASFAGVRPLVLEEGKGARETSREWKLREHRGAAALTVIGGKLTTYRLLAEAVMEKLFPDTKAWTGTRPLPGGDIPNPTNLPPRAAFESWLTGLMTRFGTVPARDIRRLAERYGTRAADLLADGLGDELGGLYEAEVRYLMKKEWAREARDILWRRTKTGLTGSEMLEKKVNAYINEAYTRP